MRSIRVFLTDKCNAECNNCFNRSLRTDNSFMDISKFELLCKYFSENKVAGIKIMGGEPTLHPNFTEMLQIAQSHFDKVSLFSNAINDRICSFRPRENDGISYNFRFHHYLSIKKMLLNYPGYRSFVIIINKSLDEKQIIKDITTLNKSFNGRPIVMLSLDCTSNIFRDKKILVSKFEIINQELTNIGISVRIDHALPICFTYGTTVLNPIGGALCNTGCAGLIDANFNLFYCNQTHNKLINLFENDKIIPFSIVENHLQRIYYQRQLDALNKICINCTIFNTLCNGGCYITNNNITHNDIILNTKLPIV